MLGAGSTAASSLMAGNVFLATANPATLMTIGSGVGSAVMGPNGIVAQAPFIAASSALMPVVAPVMLFTTVSSVVMCARLDRAQRTLGRLYEVVERVRRLLDAEDYARFETAAERIDEIRSEFEDCRRFASDVPDKLARIDHDVGVLRSKYGRMMTGGVDSEDAARAAVSDLNRFFLASLYDAQIDVLQLYLAIQNDPDVVESRQSRLREKIERYGEDFRQVLEDDRIGAYHRELKGGLPKSVWQRLSRDLGLGGEPAAKVRKVRASGRSETPSRAADGLHRCTAGPPAGRRRGRRARTRQGPCERQGRASRQTPRTACRPSTEASRCPSLPGCSGSHPCSGIPTAAARPPGPERHPAAQRSPAEPSRPSQSGTRPSGKASWIAGMYRPIWRTGLNRTWQRARIRGWVGRGR